MKKIKIVIEFETNTRYGQNTVLSVVNSHVVNLKNFLALQLLGLENWNVVYEVTGDVFLGSKEPEPEPTKSLGSKKGRPKK